MPYNSRMAKTDAFQSTFETLRALLKPYEKKNLVVVRDTPHAYFLASSTAKTRSGAAIWFGGVEVRKNYVTFHFVPVYARPALADSLSPSLRKRMHGKGCFNFTEIDRAHVKELTALTKRGYAGFIKQFA